MSRRILLVFFLVAFLGLIWWWPGDNFRIIVCDVGQGEAILFSRRFQQILVDGGPSRKILTCLNQHMPLGDKTIEMVMLTHPESDHGRGLLYVAERYKMKYFVSGGVGSNSEFYKSLLATLSSQETVLINAYRGDELTVAGAKFTFLWPDRDWVRQGLSDVKTKELLSTPLKNNKVYKKATKIWAAVDERLPFNDYSLAFYASYQDFDLLMMGEADSRVQPQISQSVRLTRPDILKVAHHGAKEAFRVDFLEQVVGQAAVISVGENSWGHPDPELIARLGKLGMEVWRTDKMGDIEIITNGRFWWRE